MPEINDELFLAAVRTFYARRFPNGDRTDDLLRLDSEVYVEDFRDALAMAFAAGREAAKTGPVEWGVRVDLPHPVRKEKVGDVIKFGGSAAEQMARNAPSIWAGWTLVRRTVPRPSPWTPVEVAR